VVSIGKPTNRLVRRLLLMYTKYVLPMLVCLVAPKEICGEYRKIYTIVSALPPNSKLKEIISKYAVLITFRERVWLDIHLPQQIAYLLLGSHTAI
jgi:demethylmenaquinone methyltransferase/2-methoxy-6-polyprenyl-1,4-benzoquinol methylase